MMSNKDYGLKINFHPRETGYQDKEMLTGSRYIRMDCQIRDNTDPERPQNGTGSNNCRPIMCLTIRWKILMIQISVEIYYSLICRGLFPEIQKG